MTCLVTGDWLTSSDLAEEDRASTHVSRRHRGPDALDVGLLRGLLSSVRVGCRHLVLNVLRAGSASLNGSGTYDRLGTGSTTDVGVGHEFMDVILSALRPSVADSQITQ